MAMGLQQSPSEKTNKLIFHHYGSQYFLTQILGEKGSQGMVFRATKQEKELQIAKAPTSNGNNIEIASK